MGRSEDLRDRLLAGGVGAVDELIRDRTSEELFLDFKRSSDNGGSSRLSDNDRNNLAKAISGFANSEGGVIVWGVDCSKGSDGADVAQCRVPLIDAKRFVSWLHGAVSGCTVPPHSGVTHSAIEIDDGPTGFALTHVPKSPAAPHQVVGKSVYFIRAGSDFVPAPHGVIAGLFGRAPQSDVFHMLLGSPVELISGSMVGWIGIAVYNRGPGISRDIFVNVVVTQAPGSMSKISVEAQDLQNWSGQMVFGSRFSAMSSPGYRLPPDAWAQPFLLRYSLSPPFETGLKLSILIGSSNSVPYRYSSHRTPAELEVIYRDLVAAWADPTRRAVSVHDLSMRLFDEGAQPTTDGFS